MMLEIIKKHWLSYLFEVIVAIVIINISFTAFLVYFYFTVMLKIDTGVELLRKIIRLNIVNSGIETATIKNKLGVTEKDRTATVKQIKDQMGKDAVDEFNNDTNVLGAGRL